MNRTKARLKFIYSKTLCIYNNLKLVFLTIYISLLTSNVVYANENNSTGLSLWDKASTIMKDVYSEIVQISTIAAVVCASVALLMMNFSKNGKTVEESRSWLKRIVMVWVILNTLGFFVTYLQPYFAGGTYTG